MQDEDVVQFGGKGVAWAGILGGVAIALGLPLVVLLYGQFLGPVVVAILTIVALIMGGAVALVAAFFGAVIPAKVQSARSAKKGDTDGCRQAESPGQA
jgi:hypothetical protein